MLKTQCKKQFLEVSVLGICLILIVTDLSGCRAPHTDATGNYSIGIKIDKGVDLPKDSAEAAAVQSLVVLAQGNRKKINAASAEDLASIPVQDLQRTVLFDGAELEGHTSIVVRECSIVPREQYRRCIEQKYKGLGPDDPGYLAWDDTPPPEPSAEASRTLAGLDIYGKKLEASSIQFCRVELESTFISTPKSSRALILVLFGLQNNRSWKVDYLYTTAADQ